MINIKEESVNKVWEELLKKVVYSGYCPDNSEYFKAERIIVEIDNPVIEAPHKNYPKSEEELNVINKYLISGENELNVWHKWTKIYYHRLFDNPYSQIEYIINKLKQEPGGKAVACTWRKEIDQDSEIMPCMLSVWCQSRNGKLDLQLHGQEGDVYKKIIMNMQEFIALQKYLANELKLEVGRFIFSLDFGYIWTKNKEEVLKIINTLN